jgi:S1-C subfamily serine protease
MPEITRANGHQLRGLSQVLGPLIPPSARPRPEDYGYDLSDALRSVVSLRSEVPEDAYTATILGTEREGSAVVIDDRLVLTIGYLIAEASKVMLADAGGKVAQARVIAYDYDTGFGLARAMEPFPVKPLQLGRSAVLGIGDAVVTGGFGGAEHSVASKVVDKREFAGYWEYLLDEAIFVAPAHPNWGGTALLGADGKLAGIGSLFVPDAARGGEPMRGNMFVPIDLLPPIFDDLLTVGRINRPTRPWLGLFVTDAEDRLVVAGFAPGGPAQKADVRIGDLVVAVEGEPVATLAGLFRKVWARGPSGVTVRVSVLREGRMTDLRIQTASRYDFLKQWRLN